MEDLKDVLKLIDELETAISAAGNAVTQEEYERNYHIVFDRLGRLEEWLGDSHFLNGDVITDDDARLFGILSRFDTAYYFVYRLNERRIKDYPNLWNYAKELYSLPVYKNATDFEALKREFFLEKTENPDKILPEGPDESAWLE